MKYQKMRGYISGILATCLMASLGFFVRNISTNEQLIALARFGFGLAFLIIYLLLSRRMYEVRPSHLSPSVMFSGIAIALCILFYIKSINSTSLVNAVFLLYLGPLISTVLSALWLGETLTAGNILLLGLAFLGCIFIFEFRISFCPIDYLGYLWGVLSAIFYAIFIVINKTIPFQRSPLNRSFYQLLFGLFALVPLLFMTEINLKHADWYWLIAIGFFQGFLALTLMITAVKYLKIYEYGIISYLEPLVATLIGYLIYSETVSNLQSIGCLIIFFSGATQILGAKNH